MWENSGEQWEMMSVDPQGSFCCEGKEENWACLEEYARQRRKFYLFIVLNFMRSSAFPVICIIHAHKPQEVRRKHLIPLNWSY